MLGTPNTFTQLRANAEAGSNSVYGRTYLPQNQTKHDQRSLYDKLKNNITYGTTGAEREIANHGTRNIERW